MKKNGKENDNETPFSSQSSDCARLSVSVPHCQWRRKEKIHSSFSVSVSIIVRRDLC